MANRGAYLDQVLTAYDDRVLPGPVVTDPYGGSSIADGPMQFRQHLVEQYRGGLASAQRICSTAWYATMAGASGVSDLALHPSDPHHAGVHGFQKC